jgi:hypothetical protein
VTAAERDEILAMRDESDAALENMGAKVDELQIDLAEARSQLHELTLERNASDEANKTTANTTAQNERAARIKLDALVAENAQLRDTTVAGERGRAEQALLELKIEREETERLDAENA